MGANRMADHLISFIQDQEKHGLAHVILPCNTKDRSRVKPVG